MSARVFAALIAANTEAHDRVAFIDTSVMGAYPALLYADRLPGTRYPQAFPIVLFVNQYDEGARQDGAFPYRHEADLGAPMPVHLSESDWSIEKGAPCLGEHNEYVFGDILGLGGSELERLHAKGVI